jgi:hypothetical protein
MSQGVGGEEERVPAGPRIMREVLRPTLVLGIYLLLLGAVLPAGVSQTFVQAAVISLSVFAAVAALIVLLTFRMTARGSAPGALFSHPADRAYAADIWLLLVPLTPIVRYVAINHDALTWLESLRFMLISAGLAALLVVVVPYFLQRWVSAAIAKMLGLSLIFTLFSMPMLSRTFSWHSAGDAVIQLTVFAVVFAVGLFLYRRDRAGAYLTAGFYFLVGTTVLPVLQANPSVPPEFNTVNEAGLAAGEYAALHRKEMLLRPDIYLLTYDAYVPNETMLQYGIDNSKQEAYLESAGFNIYPGVYTVAADSILSMGRVLGSTTPSVGITGNSPLFDALKASGYRTNGIFTSGYFYWATDPSYDSYFPDVSPVDLELLQGIMEGEFSSELSYEGPTFEDFLARKRAAFQGDLGTPSFLYTHTGPSHSQTSGACLEDEVERFKDRLIAANAEMREDIETIVRQRPNALIIVNGDHGPHLTKNCRLLHASEFGPAEITRLDIQDRFGAFLAVRWPNRTPGVRPRIKILQDVMPAVVTTLYPDVDYDALRFPQRLAPGQTQVIAGLDVAHGRIVGGPLDGQPLFLDSGGDE